MNDELLLHWTVSLIVTVLTGYVVAQLVDGRTAARISPFVLAASRAVLVPRVVAAARKPV